MSDFLVLHTLRVKGLAPLATVRAQTGLSAEQVDEVLRRLAAQGRTVNGTPIEELEALWQEAKAHHD